MRDRIRRKANVVANLIINGLPPTARPRMTQTARLERLERKVDRLARAVQKIAPPSREDDRVRARLLVLRHLRRHHEIDGVKFAAKHGLIFNDVEDALHDLVKMGSVERV